MIVVYEYSAENGPFKKVLHKFHVETSVEYDSVQFSFVVVCRSVPHE